MSDFYAQVDAYIESHLDKSVAQLARLVAQPSVSAQHLGIDECARLVADLLQEYGFAAEIIPTAGNPVVYGEAAGRSETVMLLYLHYDVQPAEPLDAWESPPFSLTRRGEHLYGRGISDDKGHIIARLAALEALRAVGGELPCRIKFVIEGEEEVGSPSIHRFVEQERQRLAADGCIWEFGAVNTHGAPTQSLGVRGICYVELSTRTAQYDAHSGTGGSIFPNAAWRLIWALNSLKGPDERIRIPDHYAEVKPPSAQDLAMLAALPDESADWLTRYGLAGFLDNMTGGLELRRRAVFEPTCTICGLETGYTGPGSKTIIPARAMAKVDFRLVPDQTPEKLLTRLRAHLDVEGFSDVDIRYLGGYPPAKIDPAAPLVQMANAAALEVYGQAPVVEPIVGGSGPMASFVHFLNVPVVSAGIGHPGGRVHAPNENIRLPEFIQGIRHTARIIGRFAG